MSVSEQAQQVARAVANILSSRSSTRAAPDVRRYGDPDDKGVIDMLSCADSPKAGITAYSTVRLSEHTRADVWAPRYEILGAFPTDTPAFSQVLATCAFDVINEGAPLAAGVIHINTFAAHLEAPALRHVLFVSPVLWADGEPKPLRLADRTVVWLMAIPITEAEKTYALTNGARALEVIFDRDDIDLFDINRPSAV
jgi:hypothetical protein